MAAAGAEGTFAASPLSSWLSAQLGCRGPFRLVPLSGGNSNDTRMVVGDAGQWLLRRPPRTIIAPTANNLEREYRVLAALAGSGVPVPRVIAYTADPAVTPTPCLLMELAGGAPLLAEWPAGWSAPPGALRSAGISAIEALAALHAVDWRAAGLGDFGRPQGYLARQVSRWRAQYERNQVRDLPLFEQLSSWLEGNRPAEVAPALIHGDYHLDNCLFVEGPPVRVSAIIDWELSTIGDPLVDLGLLLAFWGPDRPPLPAMPRVQALSRGPEAPSRRALADHYSQVTGRDTGGLSFYMTLAFFKLAAIVEGAYASFLAGQADSGYARALADDVPRLLQEAAGFADL
ncbi:MAG TPA: phosphotransferase family protein [Streptosporangiaceae bacterium]|nr:phosphotransferase family protein [Streptosporangiaceae bacterium]